MLRAELSLRGGTMAATVIITILETAAEAYAKELASSAGEGIVETLFNQGQIKNDLNEIKTLLSALSEFIHTKLPALVEHSVDLSFARKTEYEAPCANIT
jgi:hypothetical protein